MEVEAWGVSWGRRWTAGMESAAAEALGCATSSSPLHAAQRSLHSEKEGGQRKEARAPV